MMAALSAARRWRRIEKLVHFSNSCGSSGGTMPHLAQFEFDLNSARRNSFLIKAQKA
jgi:hypothetical protein